MYIRQVIRSLPLFGQFKTVKTVYTNVSHIVRIEVINNTLSIIESNGNQTTYDCANEENAQKMATRILSYQNVTTNSDYLDIQKEEKNLLK